MHDINETFAGGNFESEDEINSRIIKITNKIQQEYPELIPYIGEIPMTVPSERNPEITSKILRDYYDTLYQIVKNHEQNKPNNE